MTVSEPPTSPKSSLAGPPGNGGHKVGRRRFLLTALGGAGALAAGSLLLRRRLVAGIKGLLAPETPVPVAVPLADAELATLVSLGDVLIPSRFVEEAASPGTPAPWPVPDQAARRESPVSGDSDALRRGEDLYRATCEACHGPSGVPQPPSPEGLLDFTDPAYGASTSDGELFWKLSRGRNGMPGYEDALAADDRWRLVLYLRSLSSGGAGQGPPILRRPRTAGEAVEAAIRDWCRRKPERAADFRAAAALLDRRSQADQARRFAELDLARRRHLFDSLLRPMAGSRAVRFLHRFSAEGRSVRRLWQLACIPILEGFYASSYGWKVVGYPRARGEGSNLVDYQLPIPPS
jgi:mono/diheme cytochrome c family protein